MSRAAQVIVLAFGMALAVSKTSADTSSGILTTAAQIRSLTAREAAKKIPVCITGVVTLAPQNWKGNFFVQDSTAGVFVNSTNRPRPVPGDLLQVNGVSHHGGYSPDIASPQWKKLGVAQLPEATPVSARQLLSGVEDGNRVEVSGTVKSVKIIGTSLALRLDSGDYHFQAYPPFANTFDPNSLPGATVRIRGTAAVSLNSRQAQHISITLYPLQASDLIIDQPSNLEVTNILTSIAEVSSLTPNAANQHPDARITGVVTIAGWGGKFFIQDSSGGIFVNSTVNPPPGPGDIVEVRGYAEAGGYAPDLIAQRWTNLGTGPLPEAKPVTVDQLMTGAEDGKRIEISCVLRSALMWSDNRLGLDLASGGYEFHAFGPPIPNFNEKSLAGATVRIRGTAAAAFNSWLRQRVSVVIFMPQPSDFIVDHVPDAAASNPPFIPLNAIAQYRPNDSPDTRVRVKGVVTYQRPYEVIFLHDKTGGLEIDGDDTNVFAPGETIDAIGFPTLKNFLPVLEDAILTRESDQAKPVAPQKVAISDLMLGYHHSDLVLVQGKLLYRSLWQVRTNQTSAERLNQNTLTLQNGDHIFSVEVPTAPEFAGMSAIPIGSKLEVAGICRLQTDEGGRISAVQILLRDVGDLRILEQPGWWTPQHSLSSLAFYSSYCW